jgi:hypothetical protein
MKKEEADAKKAKVQELAAKRAKAQEAAAKRAKVQELAAKRAKAQEAAAKRAKAQELAAKRAKAQEAAAKRAKAEEERKKREQEAAAKRAKAEEERKKAAATCKVDLADTFKSQCLDDYGSSIDVPYYVCDISTSYYHGEGAASNFQKLARAASGGCHEYVFMKSVPAGSTSKKLPATSPSKRPSCSASAVNAASNANNRLCRVYLKKPSKPVVKKVGNDYFAECTPSRTSCR